MSPGMAKNTYGTGCFMLFNVGESIVQSTHGMLSTMGYQMGADAKPVYALEGSIATAGAAVAWLRDMGMIKSPLEVEELARKVEDTGEVYFVPA
jgi:glycerol kinase